MSEVAVAYYEVTSFTISINLYSVCRLTVQSW